MAVSASERPSSGIVTFKVMATCTLELGDSSAGLATDFHTT
jgi:hypothetical protein